jgi:hypothetical protein
MAVKGKREGRRKHRITRIKLEARRELARKYIQNKINKDQLEREAGPALEGVMKTVTHLQEQAGKRRAAQHAAPNTTSPAVQEAIKSMDARMAAREAARLRRLQEQRKPPPPPPKSKKRFQRGPRPGGEGQGPRPPFGQRPQAGEGAPPATPRPEGQAAPAPRPAAPQPAAAPQQPTSSQS